MGISLNQATDLAQCPLEGSYSWYLELEGGMNEPASGSINIPWLVSLCTTMGNDYTAALAKNAQVFCEPEWGYEGGGGSKDIGPGQQMFIGGSTGGHIISW